MHGEKGRKREKNERIKRKARVKVGRRNVGRAVLMLYKMDFNGLVKKNREHVRRCTVTRT